MKNRELLFLFYIISSNLFIIIKLPPFFSSFHKKRTFNSEKKKNIYHTKVLNILKDKYHHIKEGKKWYS